MKITHIFQYYLTALLLSTFIFADIPNGYYDSAQGLIQEPLQASLHDIIDNHNARTYAQLWTDFQTTDQKPNGKVWDMYSDIPNQSPPYEYTFVSDQCGNYSGEGSCYNREHSWPKSWFNDAAPMYTDLFHLVPTDGYVNGMRSNYPYGEVGTATWTSQNGSQLGACVTLGYSGTVFEPIDAYKGDFARNYFYMSTRYYGEDGGWPGSPMVNGSQLEPWALDMMMRWHVDDPISQKEIDRNDAIYGIQGNRNPYIDHPEYVNSVWGNMPVSPSNLLLHNLSSNSVTISWTDEADNEFGFYIYMDAIRVDTLVANSYEISIVSLSPSTEYLFGVSAYNADGESGISNLSFITGSGTAPNAPNSVTGSNITSASLTLTWTDNANDENGFYIYQDAQLRDSVASDITQYDVTLLSAETQYTFGIAAFNSGGISGISTVTLTTTNGGGSTETHFIEGFETGSGSSYIAGNYTLESGVWEMSAAGNFTLGTPFSGNLCLAINDDTPNAHVTTPSVNSVGTVSFYYYQRSGDSDDDFILQKSLNSGAWEDVVTQAFNMGESYTLFSYDINDERDNIKIRILSDDNTGHLIIDDFTLTNYEPIGIIDISKPEIMPQTISISNVYPNPFNPVVYFSVLSQEDATSLNINVFNIRGEWVSHVFSGEIALGTRNFMWNGTNGAGENVPSGVYMIRGENGSINISKSVTLLR